MESGSHKAANSTNKSDNNKLLGTASFSRGRRSISHIIVKLPNSYDITLEKRNVNVTHGLTYDDVNNAVKIKTNNRTKTEPCEAHH